ncbi:MAG: zinc-binding dehydrogenase [Candidatus Poribacteria bacterium]|nr:zinc-binding dehydrogenase [Candidatus Poribacteria bacterium]
MNSTAAVLVETSKPLELADLEIPPLAEGQALVEIAYSGVCHTQLLECRGYRGHDPYLPHCLGHEGSGIVREIGPGVTKAREGDAVILSWIQGSGRNVPSTKYRWGSRTVNAGAITTFNRHAVISENRLTRLADGLALREAALLGCAVPTGMGAVFNVAKPTPGDSLVIIGVGGVGLCAVLGATLAGCAPIIAVDVAPDKLNVAASFGATHCVDARATDPVGEVMRLCPGGVDIALEATGRPDCMRQALEVARPRGGTVVVIGNARDGERLEIDPRQLNQGKRLLGTWGGDSQPDRDFSRYGRLFTHRHVDVSPLLSREYRLEEINDALNDLEAGRTIRPLIAMNAEAGSR